MKIYLELQKITLPTLVKGEKEIDKLHAYFLYYIHLVISQKKGVILVRPRDFSYAIIAYDKFNNTVTDHNSGMFYSYT